MFLLIYGKAVLIMVIVDFRRNRMDNQNNKNNGPNNNRQGWGIILFTTLLVTFVVMGLYSLMQESNPEEITYDKFLTYVDNGKVESVTLSSTRIYITMKEEETQDSSQNGSVNDLIGRIEEQTQQNTEREREPDYYTGIVQDDTLARRLEEAGVEFKAEVPDTAGSLIFEIVVTVILPIVLLVIIILCTVAQKIFFKYFFKDNEEDAIMKEEDRRRRQQLKERKKAARAARKAAKEAAR